MLRDAVRKNLQPVKERESEALDKQQKMIGKKRDNITAEYTTERKEIERKKEYLQEGGRKESQVRPHTSLDGTS